MLIDTHSHLNFNAYKEDADDVVRRSLAGGVSMINVGSQYSTSVRAVEMAGKYQNGVYSAIGLHPIHLETGLVKIKDDEEEIQFKTTEEFFDYDKYKELALSGGKKVVAIGECGFDYYWKPKSKVKIQQFRQKQKEVFLKQAELARELSLPLMVHCRMAQEDLIEVLETEKSLFNSRGVIHCFTGTWDQAQKYLKAGFYLGFNGIIFKLNVDETIKKAPPDRILVETDCPYLTPVPMSGRNEPLYVKYVAEKIAKLKGESFEKISAITTQNAKELFKI